MHGANVDVRHVLGVSGVPFRCLALTGTSFTVGATPVFGVDGRPLLLSASVSDDTAGPAFNERTARPLGQSMSLNGDPEALAAYYAEWAANYDADVGDEEYGLPNSVLFTIDAAAEHVPAIADPATVVLDAGCGTGRVAMVLAARGYTTIDGVDLSPEMVEIARERGIYRDLEADVDLTKPPTDRWRRCAPLVVVGGVFTVGHIPPGSLRTVLEYVEVGGVLVTTVRPGYFDSTNYGEVSDELIASGAVDLLAAFDALPYTADTTGRYYAYRVNR